MLAKISNSKTPILKKKIGVLICLGKKKEYATIASKA
jgi:hypothetical protein